MQVRPDFTLSGTAKFLSEELNFEFRGPGFYLEEKKTMLVTVQNWDDGTGEPPWKQTWPEDTDFQASVWSCNHFDTIFAHCAVAPVRKDDRE